MRLLITGGAGFIGSHFVKRMVAAGEDVVVLDKFTYAGNPANLSDDVDCRRGDIAVREDVIDVGPVDAIVNFAAETHVDRSILGPEEFVRTDVLGTLVLLQVAELLGARLVQVSTDEVYGDVEAGSSSREDDPPRPSSPYSASKAGRRPPGARGGAHVRRERLDHARLEHVRARTSTRRRSCRSSRRTRWTASCSRSTETAARSATGSTSRITAPRSSSSSAKGSPGEVYNVGANEEHENVELTGLIVSHLGVDPSLIRHVEDRAGHDRRYSLDTAKLRSLGWRPSHVWEDGIRGTIDWYRDEPGLVGADQDVRRFPGVLRPPVHRAPERVTRRKREVMVP